MAKVLVLYYSAYGHIEAMANAVAEGAREAGATVDIKRVPELVPAEVAKASHYKLDQAAPVAKIDELAGALSHGEQRRLEIAVALAAKPSILLLDEPTQGMSHTDTADTAKLIRAIAHDVTILLIEHDIGVVMNISDHIVVMHQGKKLAEGAPSVVRADPAVKTAYFGHA